MTVHTVNAISSFKLIYQRMNQKLALIIEDDEKLSRAYSRVLSDLGYNVEVSSTIADARLCIRNLAPSLILVDIELPDGNGLDLMDELRSSTQERFIVISGNTSQQAAIKSIRHRAIEFITKPVSLSDLKRVIGKTTAQDPVNIADRPRHQANSTAAYQSELEDSWINHGSSPRLVQLRTAISYSAELRKGHALIVGEPGVEKRSVAMALHRRSRRVGSIVFLDCGAFSTDTLSDELFGTGDNTQDSASGSIVKAVGGTLVLENVDMLSRDLQSALSMFLDSGVFKRPRREESYKAIVAVVGVVSDQGKVESLRKDFSARLGQVTLNIPNLRECTSDILTIAQWLLVQASNHGRQYKLSDNMVSHLLEAPWTENIKELRAAIQASVDAKENSNDTDDELELPLRYQRSNWNPYNELVGLTLRDFGDQLIAATLDYCQGDKTKTAQTLDISLKTLYNRLNSQ